MNNNVTRLLWTGGWDSTFRLLDLVLLRAKAVQPYYIIDPGRRTTMFELKTRGRIEELVREMFPEKAELISPSVLFYIGDIKPDNEITEKYRRINEKTRLGLQYEWLARFAKQFSINDLEIGMIFAPPGTASYILRSHLEKSEDLWGETRWSLRKDEMDTDMSMFRFFSFPLIQTTKLDMMKIAEREGFAGIMDSTWFCHRPINGKPCGFCHPCCITMKMGMGQRLPRISKLRFYVYRAVRGMVRK